VHTLAIYFRSQISFFNRYQSLVHSVEIYFSSVIIFDFYILMSQTLNFVTAFDGTNYGYWKPCIRFFLKSLKYF
jgi:hypothetical protein